MKTWQRGSQSGITARIRCKNEVEDVWKRKHQELCVQEGSPLVMAASPVLAANVVGTEHVPSWARTHCSSVKIGKMSGWGTEQPQFNTGCQQPLGPDPFLVENKERNKEERGDAVHIGSLQFAIAECQGDWVTQDVATLPLIAGVNKSHFYFCFPHAIEWTKECKHKLGTGMNKRPFCPCELFQ